MTKKLKPCPFCGGKAEILTTDSYSGFDYCVMCISCIGNVDWCNTKEEAIEAWNRRVNK